MTRFANDRTEMVESCDLFNWANCRVVISKYIELSNFVSQEEGSQNNFEPRKYRLVFYSAVCHRGEYVQSGHYISIVWDRQNDTYDCRWPYLTN
jgi:uncharacterized UBP type Zn finger protein